jgi:hypothetical protein
LADKLTFALKKNKGIAMGWKGSFLIIEEKNNKADDATILKALGVDNYQFAGETSFADALYPGDGSVNIGHYNGNIIICDNFQFTRDAHSTNENLELSPEGKNLVSLFPQSEILSIAFHNMTNFHAYTIILNGKKVRFKAIDAETGIIEAGQRVAQEDEIYASSYQLDGRNFWKDNNDPEDDLSEDQLMERFSFSIARRRLGIMLDQPQGDELMLNVPFNKYINPEKPKKAEPLPNKQKENWLTALILLALTMIFLLVVKSIWF